MKVVKFLNQTWQEIPEQDNPAMSYPREECIMIFKGKYPKISDGGFVVAKVPNGGDITKLGVFWRPDTAEIFAEAIKVIKEEQDNESS